MNTSTTDPCLIHAHAQWAEALHQGIALYEAGELQAALAPLADAIRISASFHPLFHYLESGLNTDMAIIHLAQSEWALAEAAFTRAVFLHHDNEVAIAGKKLAEAQQQGELPPYRTLHLSAPLTPPAAEHGLHVTRKRARAAQGSEAVALYLQAIEICEATHLRYHQLAAQPWLVRAQVFAAQGEDALARNDIRHGMDLDRKNADLLSLSMRLAA